jgi:hypothetical protein
VSPKKVDRKLQTVERLHGLELQTANLILHRKKHIQRLKKLKEYTRMNKCTFRDKQIKKLIGEKNG